MSEKPNREGVPEGQEYIGNNFNIFEKLIISIIFIVMIILFIFILVRF